MDRPIVYPGQIPLETDLLNTNRFAMIGLAKLAAAILGTATQVSGFAATPDSPASMNVKIGAGEIYALTNLDGTAYSSLAADTAHQILKQGIMLDPVLLPLTAPATVGQSINYLIQASLQETDTGAVVLPYYNSANPAVAYSGPNNTGAAQATTRKCGVVVSARAGVAATTGSQVTPSADTGCVGMWVVTVAYGQTTITATNIVAFAEAPKVKTQAELALNPQIIDRTGLTATALLDRFDVIHKYRTDRAIMGVSVLPVINITSGMVQGGIYKVWGTSSATGALRDFNPCIRPNATSYANQFSAASHALQIGNSNVVISTQSAANKFVFDSILGDAGSDGCFEMTLFPCQASMFKKILCHAGDSAGYGTGVAMWQNNTTPWNTVGLFESYVVIPNAAIDYNIEVFVQRIA